MKERVKQSSGRGLLDDASYQILKYWTLWFLEKQNVLGSGKLKRDRTWYSVFYAAHSVCGSASVYLVCTTPTVLYIFFKLCKCFCHMV